MNQTLPTVVLWIAALANLAIAIFSGYHYYRARKRDKQPCRHSFRRLAAKPAGEMHTVVLLRCDLCSEAQSHVYAGIWSLNDFEPAPSAEELTRLYGRNADGRQEASGL